MRRLGIEAVNVALEQRRSVANDAQRSQPVTLGVIRGRFGVHGEGSSASRLESSASRLNPMVNPTARSRHRRRGHRDRADRGYATRHPPLTLGPDQAIALLTVDGTAFDDALSVPQLTNDEPRSLWVVLCDIRSYRRHRVATRVPSSTAGRQLKSNGFIVVNIKRMLCNVLNRMLRSTKDAWNVKDGNTVHDAEREAAITALNQTLTTDNPSTARFVLAEMKDSVDTKRAAQRTIEAKATSIIGLASAALAFTTAFRNGSLLMTGWVLPGLLLEFAAIVVGVAVLLLHAGALPNVLLYNRSDVVADARNEARIASALAEKWAEYERTLDAAGTVRAARLDLAFGTYILGLLWIVALSASSVARH